MSAKQPARKPTNKRKESDTSAQEGRERKRAAKRKGLKAGSRQQGGQQGNQHDNQQPADPRIGSRKPVTLILDGSRSQPTAKTTSKKVKEPRLTPEQELAAIENDERLNELLDRLDTGATLDPADQAFVDQRVDRYQVLMDELGITDSEEDEFGEEIAESCDDPLAPAASDDDLWDRFTTANYKPEPKLEPKKK